MILGINTINNHDGTYLPYNHGFEYVGHLLPFSLEWDCGGASQVSHIPVEIDLPLKM